MEKIFDFARLVDLKTEEYEEGRKTIEYVLPNGYSATVEAQVEIHGSYVCPDYDNEPVLNGYLEVTILVSGAFDEEGALISYKNERWLKEEIECRLNS